VMPEEDQIARMTAMQALVKRYNVFSWTKLFMNQLAYTKMKQHTLATEMLTEPAITQLLTDFREAGQRLILLDYDGTLVGFHANPQRAAPDPELLLLLRALTELPNTRVVLISGRDRGTLAKWLGHLPVDFITEHGVWLRAHGEDWQLFQAMSNDWMRDLRPVLELYVARTAGSFIEEKDYSLVWHYRRADADLGEVRARELLTHLSFMTANTDLQVMEGNKVLEIKNAGINKGTAAARWLARFPADFVLALGDDRTDEDTFRALPDSAYTVRVGTGARSLARFNVASPTEVRQLLRRLLG